MPKQGVVHVVQGCLWQIAVVKVLPGFRPEVDGGAREQRPQQRRRRVAVVDDGKRLLHRSLREVLLPGRMHWMPHARGIAQIRSHRHPGGVQRRQRLELRLPGTGAIAAAVGGSVTCHRRVPTSTVPLNRLRSNETATSSQSHHPHRTIGCIDCRTIAELKMGATESTNSGRAGTIGGRHGRHGERLQQANNAVHISGPCLCPAGVVLALPAAAPYCGPPPAADVPAPAAAVSACALASPFLLPCHLP